jgi:hypothetical protein
MVCRRWKFPTQVLLTAIEILCKARRTTGRTGNSCTNSGTAVSLLKGQVIPLLEYCKLTACPAVQTMQNSAMASEIRQQDTYEAFGQKLHKEFNFLKAEKIESTLLSNASRYSKKHLFFYFSQASHLHSSGKRDM